MDASEARAMWTCLYKLFASFRMFAQHLTALKHDEARQIFQSEMTTEGCFIHFWLLCFCARTTSSCQTKRTGIRRGHVFWLTGYMLQQARYFTTFFPKCVAKGSHFIEGLGVETGRLRGCFAVRNHSHPFAPVRNRPPLSAVKGPWPYLWRLLQKVSLLEV